MQKRILLVAPALAIGLTALIWIARKVPPSANLDNAHVRHCDACACAHHRHEQTNGTNLDTAVSTVTAATATLLEAVAADRFDDALRTAEERRLALLELLERSPALALKHCLPIRDYAALPPKFRALVEQPVSGFGLAEVHWSTHLDAESGLRCSSHQTIDTKGDRFQLHPTGTRRSSNAGPRAYSGYVIDGHLVINPSPVQQISPNDVAAAESLFRTPTTTADPLTGQESANPLTALIGGQLHAFASQASLEETERMLLEWEHNENRSSLQEAGLGWLAGDKGAMVLERVGMGRSAFADDDLEILFIRTDFSDFPGPPVTVADLASDVVEISGHLNTFAYGQASVTGSITTTVYRAPSTGASYASSGDSTQLHEDVMAVYDAAPESNPTTAYDIVAVYFPDLGDIPGSQITFGGRASVGGNRMLINGISSSSGRVLVITHELGHNFGLYHSNYYDPLKGIDNEAYNDPAGVSLEYGDIFDVMGDGSLPEGHFNMFQKNLIGWLPESKISDASASGVYRIYEFDNINALNNPLLALRVPVSAQLDYWIGFRQRFQDNESLSDGAYVVADGFFTGPGQNSPTLIDMTPGSADPETLDRIDAGLRPEDGDFVYPEGGVTIRTIQKGGSAPARWIDVEVDFESRISFTAAEFETDESAGVVYLNVQREFSSVGQASVDFTVNGQSATPGSDFRATNGSLVWEDGDTDLKSVAVYLVDDDIQEGIETLSVTLSNPSGDATIDATMNAATVSILDAGQRFASFQPAFFNNSVDSIVIQSSQKAVIGGIINHSSGDFQDAGNIARIDATGSRDTSFNPGGTGFNGDVDAIALAPDDSLFVYGNFSAYNGVAVPNIVRLSANGLLDTTFAQNVGSSNDDGSINAIAIDPSGRLIVGGSFTSFSGQATEGMVRLSPNGTVERIFTEFNTQFFDARVETLLVQNDGKWLAGGSFLLDNSDLSAGIGRFNADGSLDTSFDPETGAHVDGNPFSTRTVYAIAQLQDGGYLIGGSFTAYNQNPAANLARIRDDASYDPTWTPPAVDDYFFNRFFVQPSGEILVGGRFTTPDAFLFRLATPLTIDSGFTIDGASATGTVGNRHIRGIAQDSHGGVWLGGNFFDYNGSSSRPVVRVASGTPPYALFKIREFSAAQIASGDGEPFANPDGDSLVNLAELAFGTDPNIADAADLFAEGGDGQFYFHEEGNERFLEVSLDKAALDGGAAYVVQVSSDLVNWQPEPAVPGASAPYTIVEDSPTSLTVRDNQPVSATNARFMRIRVTTP